MAKESAKQSLLHNLGTDTIVFPLSILAGVLVARMLGPELKGVQATIFLIYSLILPLFMFGVSGGVRYYLARTYSVKESLFSLLLIGGAYFLLNAALVWLCAFLGYFNLEKLVAHRLLWLVTGGVLAYILNIFLSRVYLSKSKFTVYNRYLVFYKGGYFLLILLTFFLAEQLLYRVVLAMVVTEAIFALVQLAYLLRHYGCSLRLNWSFLKQVHSYGIKVWTSEVLRISNRRVDQLILAALLPVEALGFYTVGVTVAELVQRPANALVPIFYNNISSEADLTKRTFFLNRMHRLVIGATLLLALPLALLGPYLIQFVYGTAFLSAGTILLYYLPGTVLYMGTRIALQYFSATGRPMYLTYIQLTGILIGIPLYITLIPRYGIVGAAISSSIAYAITNLAAYYFLRLQSLKDFYVLRAADLQYVYGFFRR